VLILTLMENVKELRGTLKAALNGSAEKYFGTLHKVSTTISMIIDREFTQSLNCLKDHFKNKVEADTLFQNKMTFADDRCAAILDQLQRELPA
jgi:hypothetical protein